MTQDVEITDLEFGKPVLIDVRTLAKVWNPFRETVWTKCETPITPQEVSAALRNGELIEPEVPKAMYMDFFDISPRHEHVQRVAWFVKNYDVAQAIVSIDFGIPYMDAHFQFTDGNHRLAAAIYLDKETILCDWQGAISELERFISQDAAFENFHIQGKIELDAEPDPMFVPAQCAGELCRCGSPAIRKIKM